MARKPRMSATIWIFTRRALLMGWNAQKCWELFLKRELPHTHWFAFNPVEIRINPKDAPRAIADWENSAAMVGRVFVNQSEMPAYETYNEYYPCNYVDQGGWAESVSWWVD